jgi:ABC-type transport system involved in cytochrome bd biosynthesis fused ATPase/permease subunit
LLGHEAGENESLIRNVLESVNLYSLVDSYIDKLEHRVHDNGSNLSGGQKKRLAIARAILQNKYVIVLDEPTSGLDSENAVLIMNTLVELKRQGKTVIFSTHHVEETNISDQIITVKNGEIMIQANIASV